MLLMSIKSTLKLKQPQQRQTRIATRWHQPNHPLQLRHFSDMERASRRYKMSIQRLTPSHPPAISAGVLQNLQFVQHLLQ